MAAWVFVAAAASAIVACGGGARATGDDDAGRLPFLADASVLAEGGESLDSGGSLQNSSDAAIDAGNNPWFWPYTTVDVPAMYTGDSTALGDVTGDGVVDAVVGGRYAPDPSNGMIAGALFVFAGDAHGGFAAPVVTVIQAGTWAPGGVAVFDATGDGRNDVLFPYGSDIAIVPQTASGGLGALTRYSLLPPGYINYAVVELTVADVDGDGITEIIATSDDGVVVVVERDGAGGLRVRERVSFGAGGTRVGDVNGDGVPDLVGIDDRRTRTYSSQVVVRSQSPGADGGFAAEQRTDIDTMANLNAIALGDVDGDGKSDVAMTLGGNRPASKIAVLTQRAGVLSGLRSLPSTDIPSSIHVVDVDGDHRSDIVVLHESWNAVSVYLQGATGGLAPEQTVSFAYVSTSNLAAADIDGDGKTDFVAATAGALAVLRHR